MLNTTGAAHASRAPRFGVMLVLLALLAFAVREHYVLTAIRRPIRFAATFANTSPTRGISCSTACSAALRRRTCPSRTTTACRAIRG